MKSRNSKPAPRFRAGDRVQFEWGGGIGRGTVWGTIVEDRGFLGIAGRRVYYVDIPMDPYEPTRTMRAEDELEPDTISRVPIQKSELIDYLKNHGLSSMLIMSPWSERKDSPIWLYRSSSGRVAETYTHKHGLIGGQCVPESALTRGDKIDARKKDEVAGFLLSFGLTPEEAEDVIQAVGVKPVKKKPRRRKAGTT